MAVMAKKKPINWPLRLDQLRKALKLTQAEAAEKLGISVRTWQNWEQGRTRPDTAAVRLMHLTFGTDLDSE